MTGCKPTGQTWGWRGQRGGVARPKARREDPVSQRDRGHPPPGSSCGASTVETGSHTHPQLSNTKRAGQGACAGWCLLEIMSSL